MRWLAILVLLGASYGQTGVISGSTTNPLPPPPQPPSGAVQLPQNWVNGLEYIGTTTNTINFPASGTGGTWSCPTPSGPQSYGPYTANNIVSLGTAVANAETCRTNGTGNPGTTIVIPAGSVFETNASQSLFSLPQTAGDDPVANSNFIILTSDNPLPLGQTACSHGIQDNLPQSTYIGLRNFGCDGSKLEYWLGETRTEIPAGPFTLANGKAVNTADYNDVAHMWSIGCSAPPCSAISTAVGADGNGAHHYAILNANIRPPVGYSGTLNATVQLRGNSGGAPSWPTHIHLAYDYIHGDWSEVPISADPASGGVPLDAITGTNQISNALITDCAYCSFSFLYFDRIAKGGGSESHVIAQLYPSDGLKFVHNWVEGSSITTICGGSAVTFPAGVTACNDWEDRGNRWTFSRAWNMATDGGYVALNGVFDASGGTGTGARINLLRAGGAYSVGATMVQSGGSGYTVGDVLTLGPTPAAGTAQGNSSGGMVQVTAVDGSGAVTATQTVSGTGYTVGAATLSGGTTGASITINSVTPTGAVASISIVSGGAGYSSGAYPSVVQAGGSGALTMVVSVSSGAVTSLQIISGTNYVRDTIGRKNVHEAKMGSYQILDGDIFENNDYSGGQGVHVSTRPTNTSGGVTGSNPSGMGDNYSNSNHDMTFTNNIYRNGCAGTGIGARSQYSAGNGGGVTLPPEHYAVRNNLLYNLGLGNIGCLGWSPGYGFRLTNAVTVPWNASSIVENANGTTATITLAPISIGRAASVTRVGDPVVVTGCSGGTNPTGFNMVASGQLLTLAGVPMAVAGGSAPTAFDSTYTVSPTIVIPWPPAGVTVAPGDTGTGCSVNNYVGWTNVVIIDHNSNFMRVSNNQPDLSLNSDTTSAVAATLQRNITFTNTLSVNGSGVGQAPRGEGTRSQTTSLDPTTLVMHHIALPGRDTAVNCPGHTNTAPGGINICYSAFDDNHVQYCAACGTGFTNVAQFIWGTGTGYCPTSDPTASDCIGVVAWMNTASVPAMPATNWHDYRLCHATDAACSNKASQYAAGGARQAEDGTDMGANLAQIDQAQTSWQYCLACGSYPDFPNAPGTTMPSKAVMLKQAAKFRALEEEWAEHARKWRLRRRAKKVK